MEAFAAYTAQTDFEVGRVLETLGEVGQRENTLVIWEIGDNGSSMEGTLNGVFNETSSLNGSPEIRATYSSTSRRSAVLLHTITYP